MNQLCQNILTSIKALTHIAEHRNTIEQALTKCNVLCTDPNYNRLYTITTGACRYYHLYQHWIKQRCKLRAKDTAVLHLLIITLYQYHHLERVNKSQLTYQAIEACKRLKKKSYTGLINALITKATHDKDLFESQLNPAKSIPPWLADLAPNIPPSTQQAWLQPPSACGLRINTELITPTEYINQLNKQGIPYETTPTPESLIIQRKDINHLPGLSEKSVYIQDINQQNVVKLLPKLPQGALVLDACAAPGGKAGALLNQQPHIQLLAIDKNPDKLDRLRDNISHLNPTAKVACQDAMAITSWCEQKFNAILVDAPCSATGTIQAHPEIKLTQSKENITQLANQQRALLNTLWPYVAPDGYLLYSTCSILPQENESITNQFIKEHQQTIMPTSPQQHHHSHPPTPNKQGSYAYLFKKKACG
tara:strand:+ start:73 stop:1335 length:1263 start_codon:yes stop_codon:yes gene_type:complete